MSQDGCYARVSAKAALNAVAHAVQAAQKPTQHTTSLGVRHDFAPQRDLKLQIDRIRMRERTLVIDRDTFSFDATNLTVVGLAFDFVF